MFHTTENSRACCEDRVLWWAELQVYIQLSSPCHFYLSLCSHAHIKGWVFSILPVKLLRAKEDRFRRNFPLPWKNFWNLFSLFPWVVIKTSTVALTWSNTAADALSIHLREPIGVYMPTENSSARHVCIGWTWTLIKMEFFIILFWYTSETSRYKGENIDEPSLPNFQAYQGD